MEKNIINTPSGHSVLARPLKVSAIDLIFADLVKRKTRLPLSKAGMLPLLLCGSNP